VSGYEYANASPNQTDDFNLQISFGKCLGMNTRMLRPTKPMILIYEFCYFNIFGQGKAFLYQFFGESNMVNSNFLS